MGRRRWQHYQQLLMENVHLKDDDRQMEEKDWESSDKCNFCDESSNTSQQTVDNIVPESEEQPKTKNHSSESSYETEDSEEEVVGSRNNFNFRRSHQFHTSNIPESFYFSKNKLNSMSSVDSAVAASMAAVAAMNNLTNNLPKSFGNLRFPSNVSAADMLPQWYLPNNFKMENIAKRAEEPDTEVSDDQPLDLSAKTSSPLNSPRESPTEVPSPVFTSQSFTSHSTSPSKVSVYNSNRHIFKAKPRLSPMTGRRTYTEEELQAALRDIQSGKVGTRRAAVLYGIPRSTLRNKVYKLTMENERNKTTTQQSSTMDDRQTEGDVDVPSDDKEELEERENEEEEEEDGEKELSPVEEEMKDERNFMKPTFTVDDLIRLTKQTSAPIVESDSLRAFFEHSLAKQHEKDSPASAVPLPPPLYSIFPPGAAEIWGNLDAASIAPYLTHLMAATRDTFSVSSLLAHPNPYFNVRNQNSSNESPTDVSPAFSPKFAAPTLFPELLQKMLAETEEQRKRETLNAAAAAKTAGSGGGSGAVSFSSPPNADANNPSEELSGSSILRRLPLFKPSYKNGSTSESGFCNVSSDYNADNRISEGSEKSVTSSPPPINAPRSESSSPLPSNNKVLNLRDVITKAIGSRYHQQPPTTSDVHLSHISAANANASIDGLHRVSFPSLIGNSVIKSHSSSGGSSGVGGMSTEDRKICNQAKVPLPSSSAGSSNTGGGKGTRPKRGKYRNYDRDSLVEAVRAVQRGEMSVHRAGSYYGVPHSTLEYKVKERHLMRPRKREPKNQPEELKRREDGSVLRLSSGAGAGVVANEKASAQLHSPSSTAQQPKVSKSPFTPPSSLPTTPNGLKIPALFDAAAAAAAAAAAHPFAPATPFPFWPAPFHQLAMDYSRGSAFSANPEHLLASHFVQRIQEESAKTNQLAAAAAAASAGPNLAALSKNAREMAESLYDGSGINGSFLDGVIRSSLDNDQTFGDSVQKKNLLEQLYKHKYLNPNSKQSAAATTDESDDEGTKPSLNQILTQTLLSSAMSASAAAAAAAATSKDRSSSFAGDEAATLADDKNETTAVSSVARSASSTSADDDCDKVRADEMCVVGDTPQNQSLNLQVESHAVNMEVKSEKN